MDDNWNPQGREPEKYARFKPARAGGVAEPDDERAKAEAAYALAAYNYPRDPVGSRDWTLYYGGWLHRAALATKPAAPAEVVADASEAGYEIDPKSTVAELAAHVGAWETPEGFVSFGSWMALAAFRHHVLVGAAKQWGQMDEARAALRTPAQAPSTEAVAWRCGEFLFNSYEEAYECQTHDNSYAIEPLFVGAPVQPASPAVEVAKWIDDPHDIEQGQMLNPEWLKRHGVTAQQVHQQAQTPFSPATPPAPAAVTDKPLHCSLDQSPACENYPTCACGQPSAPAAVTEGASFQRWKLSDKYRSMQRNDEGQFYAKDEVDAYLRATPHPAVAVPGSLTDGRIDGALRELNSIATEYDVHEYGLPLHDDGELHRMRSVIRALATTSTAAPDIERAAQVLAECMDYPWAHMPEQGRATMRKHVESILAAAQPESGVKP